MYQKKGGITVSNEKKELVFMTFMDQMLDRLLNVDGITFWMVISGIIKYVLHGKIRKKLLSLVHMGLLLSKGCLSCWVMP